jgi:hypothetical protein
VLSQKILLRLEPALQPPCRINTLDPWSHADILLRLFAGQAARILSIQEFGLPLQSIYLLSALCSLGPRILGTNRLFLFRHHHSPEAIKLGIGQSLRCRVRTTKRSILIASGDDNIGKAEQDELNEAVVRQSFSIGGECLLCQLTTSQLVIASVKT